MIEHGHVAPAQGDDLSPSEARKVVQQANRAKTTNRSAQKRYREKSKKKLVDSDEKVAELTEQLQMLRMQKVGTGCSSKLQSIVGAVD